MEETNLRIENTQGNINRMCTTSQQQYKTTFQDCHGDSCTPSYYGFDENRQQAGQKTNQQGEIIKYEKST